MIRFIQSKAIIAAKNILANGPFYLNSLRIFSFSSKNFPLKKSIVSKTTRSADDYERELWKQWKKDPHSIDKAWGDYFKSLEKQRGEEEQTSVVEEGKSEDENLKLYLLIKAYQTKGYLKASIDPLGIGLPHPNEFRYPLEENKKDMDYTSYGFTEQDLEKEFSLPVKDTTGIFSHKSPMKLRDILDTLQKAYCGRLSPEYLHLSSKEQRNFFVEKFEKEWVNHKPRQEDQVKTFENLAWAVLFEEYLLKKYTLAERFGLEGMESLVSGLHTLIDTSVNLGVDDVTLCMAHRGRLNVLANIFRKSLSTIIAEFQGKDYIPTPKPKSDEVAYPQTGDAKYHLGAYYEKTYPDGKKLSMEILPNPSHLEVVNTLGLGKTKAKQDFADESDGVKKLNIAIHGDAAFAGQGVVYESLQMQNEKYFNTKGTLHIICNNQLGFTTNPSEGRSIPFVSDLFKAFDTPIIHVNCDDPIAVDYACKTAAEFRMKFKKDVCVHMIGYRRYGHNEIDQPRFTQPQMYKIISQKENVLNLYQKQLVKDNVLSEDKCEEIKKYIKDTLQRAFEEAESDNFDKTQPVRKEWQALTPYKISEPQKTGISVSQIREFNEKLNVFPKDFNPHRTLKKIIETRYRSIKQGKDIDFATGEALAFASLISEGIPVRLCGEDAVRGAFSHRHLVNFDQENPNKTYIPLRQINPNPRFFQPCNSQLSELSVLGFELGYSFHHPNALVLWEAQFGDFANCAQSIIDQFIAGSECRWRMQSGIVLSLPHGMDGEGPDHSSTRIERLLEIMNDDEDEMIDILNSKETNAPIQRSVYQVCYPSTSASYFHMLRRQFKRNFRKPLILPLSKRLLRHRLANSAIEEFDSNTMFNKIRFEKKSEVLKNASKVKRVLVCSGQVNVDLFAERDKKKRDDIAIIVLEQIAPFPYKEFSEAIKPFPNAELIWVQEEHSNQGSWAWCRPRINNLLRYLKRGNQIKYVGRGPSPVPSTAWKILFDTEHMAFMDLAFKI